MPLDVVERVRGRVLLFDLPAFGADPEVTVATSIGDVVKFSLRTRDPACGKARNGLAVAHLATVLAAVRAGPAPLSHKQLVALSGDAYRHLVETCGDDPGDASNWIAVKAWGRAVAQGRVVAPPALSSNPRQGNEVELARVAFGVDLSAGIDGLVSSNPTTAAMEARYGLIVTWLLMRRGLEVDPPNEGQVAGQGP